MSRINYTFCISLATIKKKKSILLVMKAEFKKGNSTMEFICYSPYFFNISFFAGLQIHREDIRECFFFSLKELEGI